MRRAWKISGSFSWKTASMTTPLISTILPVLLEFFSAMEPPVVYTASVSERLFEPLDKTFRRLARNVRGLRRRDVLPARDLPQLVHVVTRQLAELRFLGRRARCGSVELRADEAPERQRCRDRDDGDAPARRNGNAAARLRRNRDRMRGRLGRGHAQRAGRRAQPRVEGETGGTRVEMA